MTAHAVPMGAVLPRDARLGAALLAGVTWCGALAAAVVYPGHLRVALLESQRTHEGLRLVGAELHLASIGLLLLLAQVLSVQAHGARLPGPRLTRGWDGVTIDVPAGPRPRCAPRPWCSWCA